MTSTIKVNNLQNQCGANTINKCGTAITVGASGDTVTLAAGASQSGFGQTYSAVSWDTTAKTTTITGATGVGYFVNTSGGVVTANLPAGTAGDVIAFADYAATWQTNNVTVTPNGTDKIGSINVNATLNTKGQSVTFVYVDSTQGWINTMDSTSNVRGLVPFMSATVSGACNTLVTAPCCANTKIATFTGPGSFCVSAATCAANNLVSYMIIAGGGSGGSKNGGGGGAGGFREGKSPLTPYTASPLNAPTGLTVTSQAYSIVVGAGGAGQVGPGTPTKTPGNVSTFSTINSTGGGSGGGSGMDNGSNPVNSGQAGDPGGSGGGVFDQRTNSAYRGVGNTPIVSPSQGNPGGNGMDFPPSNGGGGGAGSAGTSSPGSGSPSPGQSGPGGSGVTTLISATPTVYAGGGGGGGQPGQSAGIGGTGGGGAGSTGGACSTATSGTANTGGGGGGASNSTPATSGTGGSGIVIIRYKFQ